jgi:TetR/AcrR family transcriptional repressor of nem operon
VEQPRGEPRRQALVEAAYRQIAERGFEGLRTREVAAVVGVNVATLHYYFPSKEALIRGVIGYAMQRFSETISDAGSPLDRLRGHLKALARLIKDDERLWAVMGELVLRAPRDADLARIFSQTDEFWHRTLRNLLQECVAADLARPILDLDSAAVLARTAIRGVSLPTMAGSRPALVDEVFDALEQLLGLRPSSEFHT